MRADEFKEILESIEVGLYDKWEKNFKAYNNDKSMEKHLEYHVNYLIINDFIWDNTTEEGKYWENVYNKYLQILVERDLI